MISWKHCNYSLALSTCVLVLAGGCAEEGSTQRDLAAQQAVANLAELELADGSRLTFSEPEPGVLMADAEGARSSLAITLFHQHEGSVAALFEAAAHQPPPAALLEAQARVDARASLQGGQEGEELTQRTEPSAVGSDKGTAADFVVDHCPTDHEFLYCYQSVTGTWITTENAQHVHFCVEGVIGTVHRRLEYDSGAFSGWEISRDTFVTAGSTVCTRLEVGNSANYRVTVDQTSGDTYRGSFYGDR